MTAPSMPRSPRPRRRRPGDFKDGLRGGVRGRCRRRSSRSMSRAPCPGTIKSAQIARGHAARSRDPHRRLVGRVDGARASSPDGRRDGRRRADRCATSPETLRSDAATSAMLRRPRYPRVPQAGGRISGAQAAIGTLLSLKPIIKVKDGAVETPNKVRTRRKARERADRADPARPDRAAVDPPLQPTPTSRPSATSSSLGRPVGSTAAKVTIEPRRTFGGPHLGPGCVGAVVLYRPE